MSQEIHKELESITSYLSKQEKYKVIDALRLSQEAHIINLENQEISLLIH